MLGVRLEPEIEQRLAALAERTGRSKSYYVRKAVLQALEDWEDLADAMAVLEKPGKRWTLEEIEQELDLKGNNN